MASVLRPPTGNCMPSPKFLVLRLTSLSCIDLCFQGIANRKPLSVISCQVSEKGNPFRSISNFLSTYSASSCREARKRIYNVYCHCHCFKLTYEMPCNIIVNLPLISFTELVPWSCSHWSDGRMITDIFPSLYNYVTNLIKSHENF